MAFAALVAFLVPSPAALAASPDTGDVTCGGVAPFEETCGGGPFPLRGANFGADLTGFVGSFELRLAQEGGGHAVFRCDALLLPALTTCHLVSWVDLASDAPTWLDCVALPRVSPLPPVGSWSCWVRLA